MSLHEILPHFSCEVDTQVDLDAAIAAGYCEIYIHAKDGLFKRCGLTHGRSVTIPALAIPGRPGVPEKPKVVQDLASFLPDGKIPIKFLHQIEAFFREVMKANKGVNLEAQAFVIWNPELGYHIRIPEQTVSGASVSYKWENFISSDDVIVLDMHSHNSMGAFFSGTDDRDDNGNCTISGVVGEMNKPKPAMVFRFNLPGNVKIAGLTPDDIFAQEGQGFDVPAEWLTQVKREVYTSANYGLHGRGNQLGNRTTIGGGGTANRGGTPVVSNPNSSTPAISTLGLDADETALLERFGYPFALEEEGQILPFPQRPLVRGHNSKGHKKNSGNTSSRQKKALRLPRIPK